MITFAISRILKNYSKMQTTDGSLLILYEVTTGLFTLINMKYTRKRTIKVVSKIPDLQTEPMA